MMTRKQRGALKRKQSIHPPEAMPQSQDDQTSLPEEITVEENVESSLSSPSVQNVQPVVNTVSAFEDEVTLDPEEATPRFLRFDRNSNKFVFLLSKFDYDAVIKKDNLDNKEFVKNMNAVKFFKATSKLIDSFYHPLTSYYQSGFSAKFKHNFCAVIASKLPYWEKKFHQIKQKSAKGKLSPDLSETVKSLFSYSDLLYYRLDVNSRNYIRKLAKKGNKTLKVKKNNGSFVAARNRMRKSLAAESLAPNDNEDVSN